MMFTSASARESERDAAASPSSITHQEASYAAASIIESTSDGLLIFTFMSQPSAKADSFTIPGVSAKFSLISMTSPLIGEYTSDAALTLSTTPNEPLASTELPTSGSSTYTMSPNSAYSTGDSSVIRIDENDEIAPRARAHSRLVLFAPPLSRASFASLSRAIREAPKDGSRVRERTCAWSVIPTVATSPSTLVHSCEGMYFKPSITARVVPRQSLSRLVSSTRAFASWGRRRASAAASRRLFARVETGRPPVERRVPSRSHDPRSTHPSSSRPVVSSTTVSSRSFARSVVPSRWMMMMMTADDAGRRTR